MDSAGSKAFWALTLILALLVSVTCIPLAVVEAQPEHWWDDGYYYRWQVDVTNNMAGDALPAGYPVKLVMDTVTDDMHDDGYDLRVVYWDGSNHELDRHLIDMNTAETEVWFQTYASISAGSTDDEYYIYYKNATATNPPDDLIDVFVPNKDANTQALYYFEDGSGITLTDYSDNSNTGTLTNMEVEDWVTGKHGEALNFDGTNEYVEVPDDSSLSITGEITIEAWVKQTSVESWAAIVTKGTSATWNSNNYVMGLQSGKPDFRWNGTGSVLADDVLSTDVWYHLAFVAETGTTNALKIYVNDNLVKQGNRTGNPTANNQALHIGSDDGTSDNFNGVIDGVRISNTAKSSFPYGAVSSEPSAALKGAPTPIPEIPIGPIAIVALGVGLFGLFRWRSRRTDSGLAKSDLAQIG